MESIEMELQDLANAAGGADSLVMREGTTREDQIEMVKEHLTMLKTYTRHTLSENLMNEIELNNQISNSFLTTEDIVRIASEVYGVALVVRP